MVTLASSYKHKKRWSFDDYIDAIVDYFDEKTRLYQREIGTMSSLAKESYERPENATSIAKKLGKARANDLMLQALEWLCDSRYLEMRPTRQYVCGMVVMGYVALPMEVKQIELFELGE